MKPYTIYVIKNTNKEKFMVSRRVGLSESCHAWDVYDTYEKAYAVARVYGRGYEPVDETRHH